MMPDNTTNDLIGSEASHGDPTALCWEITRRICGTLDIEQAMTAFYHSLRGIMPVNRIQIGRYSALTQEYLQAIVVAEDGIENLFHHKAVTSKMRVLLEDNTPRKTNIPEVLIVDPDRIATIMYEREVKPEVLYIARVWHNGELQGGITFEFARLEDFTEERHELLRKLIDPLRIVLSYYFQTWMLHNLRQEVQNQRKLAPTHSASGDKLQDIIGDSGGLAGLLAQVRLVAPLDVSLLIYGESGSGKEVIARHIHTLSNRANGPLVAVNCGAIPSSLIDSELFGHVKGAFTGALTNHQGRFQRASGGTLFLDEIAEFPLDVQTRLLRVLQEGKIEPVGSSSSISVNFRIIAATHSDLAELVKRKAFREDLYYRLRVVTLRIPPLRERPQDIPGLIAFFVNKNAKQFGMLPPSLAMGEMSRLIKFSWPGNIRQLENVVKESLAMHQRGELRFILDSENWQIDNPQTASPVELLTYDEAVKSYLSKALRASGGKIRGPGGAAERSGLHFNTLRSKLMKYGLEFGRDRSPSQ